MAKKTSSIQISVIVPFLNEEQYIEKCVKSLLAQDFSKSRYEVIMVDNGSTDNSMKILRKYPKLKIYNQIQKGDGAARNLGISKASGKYIAFTDADCEVSSKWLSHIHTAFISTPKAIILGNRLLPRKSNALNLLELFENYRAASILQGKNRSYYFGYTNNMAVSKNLFKQVGSFNPSYRSYDTEWVGRAVAQVSNLEVKYEPKMKIHHLEVTSAFIWIKKFYEYGRSYFFFKKSGSKFQVVPTTTTFRIYLELVKKAKLTLFQKVYLLLLLFLKAMAFKLGFFKAKYLQ